MVLIQKLPLADVFFYWHSRRPRQGCSCLQQRSSAFCKPAAAVRAGLSSSPQYCDYSQQPGETCKSVQPCHSPWSCECAENGAQAEEEAEEEGNDGEDDGEAQADAEAVARETAEAAAAGPAAANGSAAPHAEDSGRYEPTRSGPNVP